MVITLIIIRYTSPYGEWARKMLLLQDTLSAATSLPLPNNSNPLPFVLSLLSYAMFPWIFRCCVFLLLPSSVQLDRGMALLFIRSTRPIHDLLLFLTCSLILSMLVHASCSFLVPGVRFGFISTEFRARIFRNRSSLGLELLNSRLGVSASLGLYHLPPLSTGVPFYYFII